MVTKTLYKALGFKIGSYPAVSIDENDTLLQGKRGWIYYANTARTRLGVAYESSARGGKITYHDIKELAKQVRRIGVFTDDIQKQIDYANNPNLRHDK